MTFTWVPLIIILAALALALIILGTAKQQRRLSSYGLTIGGLTAFLSPMAFYLREVGDRWAAFVPTATDILLIGALSFLGGALTVLGLMTLRVGKSQ